MNCLNALLLLGFVFNFFALDLCNLFAEKFARDVEKRIALVRLFRKVDNFAAGLEIKSLRFLQQFGAMHIGAAVSEKPMTIFDATDPVLQFYENLEELLANDGLPADWAFTICNLIDSIHYFLRDIKKHMIAGLIRNLVFKNYAYKLQGVKRVAFFANFFASLHYDTPQKPKTDFDYDIEDEKLVDKILDIGKYAVKKFSAGKLKHVLEVRIYLGFISLIIADVEVQLERSDAQEKAAKYIAKANLDNSIGLEEVSLSLIGLWRFLHLYSQMILDPNVKLDRDLLMHSVFLLPECKERYHKAICTSRHYKFSTCFAEKWLERLEC